MTNSAIRPRPPIDTDQDRHRTRGESRASEWWRVIGRGLRTAASADTTSRLPHLHRTAATPTQRRGRFPSARYAFRIDSPYNFDGFHGNVFADTCLSPLSCRRDAQTCEARELQIHRPAGLLSAA
jgi:hypothetical protein